MRSFLAIFIGGALALNAATLRVTTTLAAAVAGARPGDTVVVDGPRVFGERLVIDRPIRLLGRDWPVVDAGNAGTTITIAADGVEVRGLVVRNAGADLGKFDSGIMIKAGGATVEECRIETGGFGIYVSGSGECSILRNTVTGATNLPPAQRGNGIHLWKSARNRIEGNRVTETRDGIYLSYADENLIAGNEIERTRFGLHYMYSHRNRLLENSFTANVAGAALMFARNCVLAGNRAYANRRHGFLLFQVENSRIERNELVGQNRGLFAQMAVQNRFTENLIARNDIGLYLSNGSEENVFSGNEFVANSDQVWQPPDEVSRGSLASNRFHDGRRGNFWSDYTGADADGDGLGDTPYHETDLFGYLVDHFPEARVLAASPAAALLRKGEEILPLLDVNGVNDPYPLMRASTP